MKYITAVVRRRYVGDIIHTLEREGFSILSACDASVVADLHDPRDERISFAYEGYHTRMSRIELLCADNDTERALRTIESHGHTDHQGDGFILVWPVERGIQIQTGEEGVEAFQACKGMAV
mgnify:CR=1 FL=1